MKRYYYTVNPSATEGYFVSHVWRKHGYGHQVDAAVHPSRFSALMHARWMMLLGYAKWALRRRECFCEHSWANDPSGKS